MERSQPAQSRVPGTLASVPNETREALCIVGPTAIGKTAAAIATAERLGGRAEILSADSVQIYRGLDIGSAKPTGEEQRRARFHLIDIAAPDQEFTVADYQYRAVDAFRGICARGNVPLIVGGAGLYVRSLTAPLGIPHVPPNLAARARWSQYAAEHGVGSLHQVLQTQDEETAARLHVNDHRRIIRALEVFEFTGRKLSHWHRDDRESGAALEPTRTLVGLNCDRQALYDAIDGRVDGMIRAGFVEEVEALRSAGASRSLHSMRTLGYNEISAYLDGEATLSECIETIKRRTRQYARRQLIWFRADSRIQWLETGGKSPTEIAAEIAALVDRKHQAATDADHPGRGHHR